MRYLILTILMLCVGATAHAATNITACGRLATASETYILQNDVTSDGTCFFISANDVTLDLNGHTITYDNATPITITNGSFESALAGTWDTTGAANASRFAGSFLASSLYDGSYSLRVTTPTTDQVIKQASTITLQPNTTYSISAMYHNQVADSVAVEIGLLDTNDQVITGSNTIISNRAWRGIQYFNSTYATGVSPVTAKVYLKVSNAGAAPSGAIYLDDVKVQRHLVHGIQVGKGISIDNQRHASDEPDNINGASRAIITSSVAGAKIVQGPDNGSYSDAIFIPGNWGSGFTIENLEITVQGAGSRPMHLGGCVDATVRNNTIHHNTQTIKSRDNFDGASIFVQNNSNGGRIYNNIITASPQNAIVFFKALTSGTLNQIYGNTITMQTRYTNDFAIFATNAIVHDNVIDCGSGNNSCRGIHIGVQGNPSDGGSVYNNTITVQELSRNQEYGGCEMNGAYGIQIEDETKNLEVYGNTITANAGACDSTAFRPSVFNTQTGNYIHDNTFTAVTSGAGKAYAIRFEGGTDAMYTISGNTFRTNYAWLMTEENEYNPTQTAFSINFVSNRWETTGTLASPFRPFEINPYYHETGTNILTASATFSCNTYGTGDQARFEGDCWRSTYAMGACLAGSSMAFDSNCSPINGTCGGANGQSFSTLTSANGSLCGSGIVNAFTGSGPWSWSCAGLNGGSTASCSASVFQGSSIDPPANGPRVRPVKTGNRVPLAISGNKIRLR